MAVKDDFFLSLYLFLLICAAQIERAQLSEFDWALANMNARSRSKKKGPTAESETLEEDAKARRDDVRQLSCMRMLLSSVLQVDFRGLASLLLDDSKSRFRLIF